MNDTQISTAQPSKSLAFNRTPLATWRRTNPALADTINGNHVVAMPVQSLTGAAPAHWRCFVNGFELTARFTSADAVWDNAQFIAGDFCRSPHVAADFFLVPVQPR